MTADRLRHYVERIERLVAERTALSEDIRGVYSEAKAEGFDVAPLRKLIARRGMEPHHRVESDAMLETYESALGMVAGDFAAARPLTETRPDAAAIALELLTAEIVALEDPGQAAALVEHVTVLLDIRAEIAVLRGQEGDRRKLAKAEGFDAKQLALVVRWYEKVAKYGLAAMRTGEETFRLYRGTVDEHDARSGMTSERDRALAAKFAGGADERARKRAGRLSGTLAAIAAMDAATKREGGHG